MNLLVFTLNNFLDAVFLFPAGENHLPFLQEIKSTSPEGGPDTHSLSPFRLDFEPCLVKRIRPWAGFCSRYYDQT